MEHLSQDQCFAHPVVWTSNMQASLGDCLTDKASHVAKSGHPRDLLIATAFLNNELRLFFLQKRDAYIFHICGSTKQPLLERSFRAEEKDIQIQPCFAVLCPAELVEFHHVAFHAGETSSWSITAPSLQVLADPKRFIVASMLVQESKGSHMCNWKLRFWLYLTVVLPSVSRWVCEPPVFWPPGAVRVSRPLRLTG